MTSKFLIAGALMCAISVGMFFVQQEYVHAVANLLVVIVDVAVLFLINKNNLK